ncbi:MAG: sulfur transferase domain-containing protein [Fimbriimonadales bacterium]
MSDIHFPEKLSTEGFQAGIWDVGPCRVSGQPRPEAFRKLAAEGVKTVINLRGTAEMNDRTIVDFDEAKLLGELGIHYVHIPVGEPHEYSPAAIRKFNEAMEKAKGKGKILLHCTVAWRASYVWGTYLHKFKGYALTDAIRHALAMNASQNRVESLLGITVEYSTAPKNEMPPKSISAPNGMGKKLHAPTAVFAPNDAAYMDWTLWDMGDVMNGSQPNEKQLRDLVASKGITTVINIRGPQEVEAVKQNGFDEEAVASSLGLTYVSVPMQSPASFSPANLKLVADAIAASKGPVLLHCQTGTRTSSVWAAYLTKFAGVGLDDAMGHGEAMRYSDPFESFLEMDLVYKVKKGPSLPGCGGG